jgi:hypothetical protein
MGGLGGMGSRRVLIFLRRKHLLCAMPADALSAHGAICTNSHRY